MPKYYENKNTEIDRLVKDINSRRPFDKKILKELSGYYRIGFTYSSNAIEGNSLPELKLPKRIFLNYTGCFTTE
ncbi:MAG: hypothetical protein LBR69_01025 [Endomicrobium sp.]|jgi:hypothetical protein|nr:hypothetical protein [Endomicrobium sp.]